PILQMNSIARRIIVDPWGSVTVQEDHVIFNTGQLPVTTYNFRIPLNATNFTITDAFEAVEGASVSSTTNWDGKTVNVTVSLATNRAPLLAGDTFRYTISYELPLSMFASESWNNYYCFLQSFPTQMDFLIVSETTQIILNGGSSVTSVSPNPESTIIEGMQTTLTFSDSMVSPLQQRVVQISYQVNVFWIIWRPLVFILMFFVASAAYVYARKGLRKVPTQGMADQINIPAKDLQQFVSLYEEKSALQQELDTLNEDVKMKKIPKKSYNKRVKDIQTKSKELDEDIKPLRKSLGESDERFRKIMEKLQFFEAERISVEDSLLALDARYRRGAIPSRSAFQKLYSDFTKRMQKMQRETDKLLSELKSYIY
ncbi:MAG TPA: hypothetical protein VKK79_06035, partial [Candidatus Lokiarchaeia archaeon]|nr:hypothetical protein [Candidatus Lokiarchaeia archaeon]